jgi:hypothetical protein
MAEFSEKKIPVAKVYGIHMWVHTQDSKKASGGISNSHQGPIIIKWKKWMSADIGHQL